MATKSKPGKFDCHANARWDEPLFVLLARDWSAPWVVRFWALCRAVMILLRIKPASDLPMVWEAAQCARDMKAYRRKPTPLMHARHDITMTIGIAGAPVSFFIEYDFGHGGPDFFAGGCWNQGDAPEVEFGRVFVVVGEGNEERHLEAPPWLAEIVANSGDVFQRIAESHGDDGSDYLDLEAGR